MLKNIHDKWLIAFLLALVLHILIFGAVYWQSKNSNYIKEEIKDSTKNDARNIPEYAKSSTSVDISQKVTKTNAVPTDVSNNMMTTTSVNTAKTDISTTGSKTASTNTDTKKADSTAAIKKPINAQNKTANASPPADSDDIATNLTYPIDSGNNPDLQNNTQDNTSSYPNNEADSSIHEQGLMSLDIPQSQTKQAITKSSSTELTKEKAEAEKLNEQLSSTIKEVAKINQQKIEHNHHQLSSTQNTNNLNSTDTPSQIIDKKAKLPENNKYNNNNE